MQELDETCYWLELISEAGIFAEERVKSLRDEANDLIAILVSIVKRVKERGGKPHS